MKVSKSQKSQIKKSTHINSQSHKIPNSGSKQQKITVDDSIASDSSKSPTKTDQGFYNYLEEQLKYKDSSSYMISGNFASANSASANQTPRKIACDDNKIPLNQITIQAQNLQSKFTEALEQVKMVSNELQNSQFKLQQNENLTHQLSEQILNLRIQYQELQTQKQLIEMQLWKYKEDLRRQNIQLDTNNDDLKQKDTEICNLNLILQKKTISRKQRQRGSGATSPELLSETGIVNGGDKIIKYQLDVYQQNRIVETKLLQDQITDQKETMKLQDTLIQWMRQQQKNVTQDDDQKKSFTENIQSPSNQKNLQYKNLFKDKQTLLSQLEITEINKLNLEKAIQIKTGEYQIRERDYLEKIKNYENQLKNQETKKQEFQQHQKDGQREKDKHEAQFQQLQKESQRDKINHEAQIERLQKESQREKTSHEVQFEKLQKQNQRDKINHEAQIERLQKEIQKDKLYQIQFEQLQKDIESEQINHKIQLEQLLQDFQKDKINYRIQFEELQRDSERNKINHEIQLEQLHKDSEREKVNYEVQFQQFQKDIQRQKINHQLEFQHLQKDSQKQKINHEIQFQQLKKDSQRQKINHEILFKQLQKDSQMDKTNYQVQFEQLQKDLYKIKLDLSTTITQMDFMLKEKEEIIKFQQNEIKSIRTPQKKDGLLDLCVLEDKIFKLDRKARLNTDFIQKTLKKQSKLNINEDHQEIDIEIEQEIVQTNELNVDGNLLEDELDDTMLEKIVQLQFQINNLNAHLICQ